MECRNTLVNTWIRHKVVGASPLINDYNLCSDGRKRKRIARELIEAGYLVSNTGDYLYRVTSKAFDEVQPESVCLIAEWNKSRLENAWNSDKDRDFVRFDIMTDGQKRTVIENADIFQWFACDVDVLRWRGLIEPDQIAGPVKNPLSTLGSEMHDLFNKVKNHAVEIVLRNPALTEYIEKTIGRENIDKTFRANLAWGLEKLGVVDADAASNVTASSAPAFVLGGLASGNVGEEPEKWGNELDKRIEEAEAKIVRAQERLFYLKNIKAGIERFGGWDVFRQKMREELTAELHKQTETPAESAQ